MTALTPTVHAPSRSRTPAAGVTDMVFIRRSIMHSLRDGEGIVMAIMLPVLLMLLFTFVFGGAMEVGGAGGYVDYIVPGIILLCAGFGASSTAMYVARDLTTGIMGRFRTMPIRGNAVLTGHVVASVLRNLIATGVVFAVGLLVGFRPTATPLEWIAAIGVIALYILVITWLFAAIGLAAGTPEAANGYGFILLFLPYLSSAFVPVETMPDWLQWVAENQPITPIIETLRSLLMGTPMEGSGIAALLWCAAILAVAIVWGAWMFRRKAGRR